MEKDLFGNDVGREPSKQEWYLRELDKQTFQQRVRRLEYLHKLNPDGLTLAGEFELVMTYQECQQCYINGNFLATVVLSFSFIEKFLQVHFVTIGELKSNKKISGEQLIKLAIEKGLIPKEIALKMDFLRLIRNPITHLKPNYQYNVSQRSFEQRTSPLIQIENDAKTAITMANFLTRYL